MTVSANKPYSFTLVYVKAYIVKKLPCSKGFAQVYYFYHLYKSAYTF